MVLPAPPGLEELAPPDDGMEAGMGGLAELLGGGPAPGAAPPLAQPPIPGAGEPLDGMLAPPADPTARDMAAQIEWPPYAIPTVARRKRPSNEWIIRQRSYRTDRDEERNLAMAADEAEYLMATASETKADEDGGEEDIHTNAVNAMVNKICYMVGRQQDKIEVTSRWDTPEGEVAAQLIEDFLYEARRVSDQNHRASGKQGLAHNEAYYGAVRGWIPWRAVLDPAAEWPWTLRLYDPFNCYPRLGRQGAGFMVDMILYEETTVGEFLARNPQYINDEHFQDPETGDLLDDDQQVYVTHYEDAHWLVVLVELVNGVDATADRGDGVEDDSILLYEEEHGFGFCPWVMLPCSGTPSAEEGARAMNGSGLVRPIRSPIGALNRLLSQVHTDVAAMANPATVDEYGGPDTAPDSVAPDQLDFRPGARNSRDLSQGQRSHILSLQTRPDQIALLYQEYKQQIDRGGVLPVLYGDAAGMQGGFHQSIVRNAAEDALFPVTDTIITGRQMANELLLNLVLACERRGILLPGRLDGQIAQVWPVPNQRKKVGVGRQPGRIGAASQPPPITNLISPRHIRLQGVRNSVSLRRMTPMDLLQMVQAAVMAASSKLLSLDWLRRNWLDVDDPLEMNEWIIYEAAYSDPEAMRGFFLPQILQRLNPELLAFLEQQKLQQAQAQQGAGLPPGAMPPGAPPGQPGAPPPGLGVGSELLPAEMQAPNPALRAGQAGGQQMIEQLLASIIEGGGQ